MLQNERDDLEARLRRLEHFVETQLPLALLRASDLLGERFKIPHHQVLHTLERELHKLWKGEASGTSTNASLPTD